MSEVRVRFAPSPTGYLHVGNARTAILNWLFARHSGGKMILRIEDTDAERSTVEFEQTLLQDLAWLGVDWDEGPDKGGNFGPYRQSERLGIYQKYAHQLLETGKAFHCYCTKEEIEARGKAALARREDPHYDGHCYYLTEEHVEQYKKEGRKPVIRFRVHPGEISFSDLVRKNVQFDGSHISDFVILRSDSTATYNFAVVIDDALMKISHVIRGEDHLSNTPKQVLLFKAFGFDVPVFVHIPMILGEDRAKLSKRHGDNQVRDYREKGYLPEAMFNFLSLLGWSSPSGEELLSRQRFIEEFDFSRLSKSAAIFNSEKLDWMNGWYLRNSDIDYILDLGLPFLKKSGFDISDREAIKKCVRAVIERIDRLEQLPDWCRLIYAGEIKYDNEEIVFNEGSQKVFIRFLSEIENISQWDKDAFLQVVKTVQKETGIKGRFLWMPIRIALTGKEHGPELPVIVELLGLENCRKLIKKALKKQG
ncbi:MAG TPA: glutamate--tRNA ligase [Bacteroidetes bacterium]|nr:glutamate--tRNA ligase [Bacteroidota bacterium]